MFWGLGPALFGFVVFFGGSEEVKKKGKKQERMATILGVHSGDLRPVGTSHKSKIGTKNSTPRP